MRLYITDNEILFRKPVPKDGKKIHELVKKSPPLDLNSIYSYYLLTNHHANTCMVAEFRGEIVGFISAYFLPDDPQSLFIWQVVVDEKMRGQSLGGLMLSSLLSRPECKEATRLKTTVSPGNKASRRMFEKYCDDINSEIELSDFISADDFGEAEHEAEELFTINLDTQYVEERKYANF